MKLTRQLHYRNFMTRLVIGRDIKHHYTDSKLNTWFVIQLVDGSYIHYSYQKDKHVTRIKYFIDDLPF